MRIRFYLKSIIRKILVKPLFPVISIIGLTIGFVVTVLVADWLKDEFSYDRFNKNADRIYRLTVEIDNKNTGLHWNFARSYYSWLKNIKKDIPGIESMVRISRQGAGIVKVNTTPYDEDIFYADSTLTSVFTFHFLEGDPKNCLSRPGQVIISKSAAKKYFGNQDALGKTILLYCSRCREQKPCQITGIFEDIPVQSHIHFNVIVSRNIPDDYSDWAYNYLLLEKNVSPNQILNNFISFAGKYVDNNELSNLTPHLQKITDIHLYSSKDRELENNGNIHQIHLLIGLMVFILFISLFNFSTIRYVALFKEYKSIWLFRFNGATKKSIYASQILEVLVYSLLAAVFTFFIIKFTSNDFNHLISKNEFTESSISIRTTLLCLIFLVFISVLAGIFSYWIFSTPFWDIIKNVNLSSSSQSSVPKIGNRNVSLSFLLSIQYVSTFLLIFSVIVINAQLNLFQKYSLGNNSKNLLCIEEIPCQIVNKYQIFKEKLLRSPLIQDVTISMENPGDEIEDMTLFETSGADNDASKKLIYLCPVDDNFFSFYGIHFKAGKDFPIFSGNDTIAENFILNEEAVKYIGWENCEDAIGRPFRLKHDYASKETGKIIGVVSNFQPSSIRKTIKPYVFFQKSFWLFSVQVKYDTAQQEQSFHLIRETWDKIYPDYPMKYTYVSELYKEIYKNEFQLRDIGIVLCIIALFLSALGLFGTTGIVYEARTKEIGIRKVNGAKFTEIAGWLLNDIIKVVMISLLIAVPLSWYIMQIWLKNYAYKVTINAWMFLLGGIIISVVALLTVCWQTWRTATSNPVEALRYE